MSELSPTKANAWIRPDQVMVLHKLKTKKKALQARMNRTFSPRSSSELSLSGTFPNLELGKRKNPFSKGNSENKKPKTDETKVDINVLAEDDTLYKLLNPNKTKVQNTSSQTSDLNFSNVLNKLENLNSKKVVPVKHGEKWFPVDWTLKNKLRLMSPKPFAWNRKLKTSEEASGITGFVRCLDTRVNTSLDTSPNAQFHQCCLYWQHPSLPWLQLFPRVQGRVSATAAGFATNTVKSGLHSAWTDSLKSLFQLVRARQCPYFYVCANMFTAVFRAAGLCGNSELHVLLTPTTRGFRQLLRQEDIEFKMPLKTKRQSTDGNTDSGFVTFDGAANTSTEALESAPTSTPEEDDEDGPSDAKWLESMGVLPEDIKKINNIQVLCTDRNYACFFFIEAKIDHRAECEIDNSEQSLIYIEGMEAHALYNFLINCKSIVAITGSLAGIPPTLLAPVAFHGASLQSLKVREHKIHDNNSDFYSLELSGPILPHTIHTLYSMLPNDCSVSATFANIASTSPFSKVQTEKGMDEAEEIPPSNMSGSAVFGQENLSDCGLSKEILHKFCSSNPMHFQQYDSLKYNSETGLYIWM